jgi:hypothetical protein
MANAERKRLTAMGLLVALALSALLCSAAGSASPTAATTSHRHLTSVVKPVTTHLSAAPRARIGVIPLIALAPTAAVAAVLLPLGIVRPAGPGRPPAGARRPAHARAPPA